jgi:hypothetical protein
MAEKGRESRHAVEVDAHRSAAQETIVDADILLAGEQYQTEIAARRPVVQCSKT